MQHNQDTNNFVQYKAKNGEIYHFNISSTIVEVFGFAPGLRVITPKGQATVIGEHDGFLWFHIDGDPGASYWDNCKTYEDLLQLGVSIVAIPEPEPEMKQGEYKIKRVDYLGRVANIMLQNENGPCPLLGLGNILALRNWITIEGKNNRISVEAVVQKIGEYLRSHIPPANADDLQNLERLIKIMPDLQVGLDVNCGFTRCTEFEATEKLEIFKLLKIKVLHGWLVDPQFKAAPIISPYTYNDLTLKLVALAESKSLNPTVSENNEVKKEEKEEKKLSPEEGISVEEFLNVTAHQLTEYGLNQLHKSLDEDELAIFFRNNHFSTLTKHSESLYNLVTDIGYERERNVVWDLLSTVDGDSYFFSGEFTNTDLVKKEEVLNTAILCGYGKENTEEAIKAVSKPNEELKVDDVLDWLNKHAVRV